MGSHGTDYSYNNENSCIKEYWMNNYNGINYANNVSFRYRESAGLPVSKMSAEDENHLTGEALFLRAYFHFKLIMSWEKGHHPRRIPDGRGADPQGPCLPERMHGTSSVPN